MMTADAILAAGTDITRAEVEHIDQKFRTEIGGVYELVAASIRQQHAHLFDPPARRSLESLMDERERLIASIPPGTRAIRIRATFSLTVLDFRIIGAVASSVASALAEAIPLDESRKETHE